METVEEKYQNSLGADTWCRADKMCGVRPDIDCSYSMPISKLTEN